MRGGSHTLTVRTRTPTVDAEGQISYADSDATVKGRVMITNVGIGDDGGKNTNQPEAVAWVPTGTTVTDAAQIVVAGLDPFLNGTYNIDTIQHTSSHLRLLLLGART
jgi:hypothetical protein